ncbi:uncharacterized protein LOC141656481 [Silene latifolia]|uniref:uncharacterized protein LOC141656481 n=1 Tax=Silene latifolia TaxID=37657 RepID=UPI003D784E3A
MSLSDDEQIVTTPYDTDTLGMKYETLREGDIKATTINKKETGMEESHLSVFLEVTGAGYENVRPGLDIVTVLDVNDSMKGEKLETMKGVMRLLIDKLSSADRLSIVTVSKDPLKLFGLRQISIVSRGEIEKLVSGLETYPGNDIDGGLGMAFKVINDRKYGTRRPAAVLIMSDGDHIEVPSNHVSFQTLPVYTIGFGDDHGSMVLNDIAKRSDGGIYCPIDVKSTSPSNITNAFSKFLAKLFTIVVSDLKLTFKTTKSTVKIVNVSVGTYSCSYTPFTMYDDHVIVPYGDLFANETCKVKVGLLLPRVDAQEHCDLLHVSYSCRIKGEVFNSSSRHISVTRKMDNLGMNFGNKRLSDSKISRHLKQAFNSVKLVGGKLTDYVDQYIGFQANEGTSNDLVRSQNVDSNPNPSSVMPLEGEPSEEHHMEYMSDRVKQAFESIKTIRGILSNYVDQYVGIQASEGDVDDLDRSQNIKALGDHIRLTFDSIKAIEDILQNVESIPSFMINLKGGNINEPAEIPVEQSDGHHESNQVEHLTDYCWNSLNTLFIVLLQLKNWLTNS